MRGVATGGGRFGSGAHDGERAERPVERRMAGVAWRLGSASGTRVHVGRCQGAGQVALEGSPGPPAAYGRRRRNRGSREERDGDRRLSVISEIPGTYR